MPSMTMLWYVLLLGGYLSASQCSGDPEAILRMDIGTINRGKLGQGCRDAGMGACCSKDVLPTLFYGGDEFSLLQHCLPPKLGHQF